MEDNSFYYYKSQSHMLETVSETYGEMIWNIAVIYLPRLDPWISAPNSPKIQYFPMK